MDEDKYALVEKIIKDIDNVMSKNAELNAFDIVPVDSNFCNKSPVLHFENCLGLESWCVKHVYTFCYTELMDKHLPKQKRPNYKLTSMHSERLTELLNVTLLLNPEISTLWNKRREMVDKCLLEKSSELQFTRLVLSRKAKCNDAFAYRRWILETILQDDNLQSHLIQNITNEELRVCELASDKSPNNYHSWNHRMWLIITLEALRIEFDLNLLYIKEYGFSERWTSKHISDFSCFHYRQFCIKNIFTIDDRNWKIFQSSIDTNIRKNFVKVLCQHAPKNLSIHASKEKLITCSEDNLINLILCHTKTCGCPVDNVLVCRKLEVLFYELLLNNELLQFYKYHETLWYHRRFIVHEIIVIMYEHFELSRQNGVLVKNCCRNCNFDDTRQKQAKIVKYDCNKIYSSPLFNVLLCHEKKYIDERSNDGDNYADRHEKYLKFVEGLNNVM